MRKLTMGFACSLDHYIAGPDGAIDWILFGPEAGAIMQDYWKTIDTVLLGRKTYVETIARMGGAKKTKTKKKTTPAMRSYVFSRTLKAIDDDGAELVSGDAAEFVRALKAQPGKDICLMGGGELGRSLLEAGLVDELGLNVHPVLLGGGTPLFLPMDRPSGLRLLECRAFANGCAFLRYGRAK